MHKSLRVQQLWSEPNLTAAVIRLTDDKRSTACGVLCGLIVLAVWFRRPAGSPRIPISCSNKETPRPCPITRSIPATAQPNGCRANDNDDDGGGGV